MSDEIQSIIANAINLKHLDDDECFRLGETIANALTALSDEEREELVEILSKGESE